MGATEHAAATNHGFRLTVNARFIADYSDTMTMTMSYGLGDRRFLVWFHQDNNGDLTATLEDGPAFTLTTHGTGSVLYHTHEILFDPTNGTASYLFDGVLKTNNWPSSTNASPAGRVSWGAGRSEGQGQMNFNRVALEITNKVLVSYDAGTKGSPPVAPNPATQGWEVLTAPSVPGTTSLPIAADAIGALPNAWQISDDSSSTGSGFSYTNQLDPTQQMAATNHGFHFSINARFVTKRSGADHTLTMNYGLGDYRYLIWFDLNGNGDLTAELEGGLTYTLTTNRTGSALYHTHEIVFNPGNQTASYLFDGMPKTNGWRPTGVAAPAGQISWGAGRSAGEGRMNFHTVTFAITNLVVASYDAGMVGDPPAAPDPLTQGWSGSPTRPGLVNLTGISPDLAVLPSATTLLVDQFRTATARLNGQTNPRGSPAMAWFEWGTTLAYGDATAPQSVGAGITPTNVAGVLTNLAIGPIHNFRLMVSNAFGIVSGDNQSFIHPGYVEAEGPGLPGVRPGSLAREGDQGRRLDFLLAGGLVMLGMAGAFFGLYQWRVRQHRRDRAAQESYSRALIASQEEERKRVAAELHDSLGQSLQIIKGRAQWGLSHVDAPGEGKKQLEEICEAATQAIGEVRAISHALRPAELDQLGLTRAVEWMAQQAGTSTQTRFACELDDLDKVFPPEFEISLYRIAQEGISNVLKHARASEAILEIKRSDGIVRLSLFDDGCGFVKSAPTGSPRTRFGQGLAGIAERVKLMGGEFDLQSAPGRGTRLTVRCRVNGSK